MAEVTAALVKQLREQTGAGMMDCKKALAEADADLEAAAEWLRKKGLAAAAKKAGRVAAEGLIGIAAADGKGAIVEVNSETDFVARNEVFQKFVGEIGALALEAQGDLDNLKSASFPGSPRTVEEEVVHQISTIGENINLRRSAALSVDPGIVASYVHNAVAPGLGKIGVVVALKSDAGKDELAALGKQLAMHIAATNPLAVSAEDLDQAAVDKEREILREQAATTGKPDDIVDKMVEGRLRKYYQEVVLLDQTFVIDGETRVGKVLEGAAKSLGKPVAVAGFVRFALGEGIDKGQDDFAAEVAQLVE